MRDALAKWGTPPAVAGEPVFAFRRKGFDDFCTCTEERYAELSAKPNLFETRIFYTTPPTQDADSALEDAVLLKEARDALWQPANVALCERIDAYLDAARAAQEGKSHGTA